jgi:hypothetical protein
VRLLQDMQHAWQDDTEQQLHDYAACRKGCVGKPCEQRLDNITGMETPCCA